MRIYTGLKEAYNEIQRDLVEMGTEVWPQSMQNKDVRDNPDFITKEIQGYCYSITSDLDLVKDFKELGGNEEYLKQELNDRLSERWLNPGNAHTLRPEVWKEFRNSDGRMNGYTYNERLRDQVPIILEELKRNPSTRQAIITVWDKHHDIMNLGGKNRVPCSLSYQFLIRRDMVDVIYTMRSCDIYTHFIYDVALTMGMNSFIANAIGREPGKFIHFMGSLHAYKKDYDKKGIF
jgi:thymidylate synthase